MLYHVFARGNDKQCIYKDDSDCRSFQELLAEALLRFGIKCVAYCLMRNHYHLLLRVGDVAVSRLMQQLNSSYCQGFNRRHGRVGHVLQGRFGSRIVEDGAYTRTVLRYLALNPVAAGLVSRPGDWRWSSYRFALGVGEDERPDFLSFEDVWRAFGTSDPEIGRSRFADFVAAGLQEVFSNPLLHGSDRLSELAAPLLKPHETTHEHPHEQRHATRSAVGSLFDGRFSQADLDDAAYAAFVDHAYTLEEIGRAVSRHPSVVCRWIRRAKQRRRETGMASQEDKRAKNKI